MWEVMQAKIEARPPSLANVRKLICERDELEEVPPVMHGKTLVPQPPRQVKGLKVNCELMAREGGEQIAGLVSRFLRDHGKNELSGIQSTFATQTEFLLSKPIARDLEKGNWSFAQLREKPTTVYILLPPEEIKDKRRWTRLLFTCALCEHLKPGPVRTLFILDEFRVAIGHLAIINDFWSLVAGYGVQFLVVCQSVLHLKALFKDEWEIYAGQAGAVATLGAPGDHAERRMDEPQGWHPDGKPHQPKRRPRRQYARHEPVERRNRLANRNCLQVAARAHVDQGRHGPDLDAGPGQYLDSVLCPELLETAEHRAADRSEPLSPRARECAAARRRASCHENRDCAAAECNVSARGNGGDVRRGGVRRREYRIDGVAQRAICPCLGASFTRPVSRRRLAVAPAPDVAGLRAGLRQSV